MGHLHSANETATETNNVDLYKGVMRAFMLTQPETNIETDKMARLHWATTLMIKLLLVQKAFMAMTITIKLP